MNLKECKKIVSHTDKLKDTLLQSSCAFQTPVGNKPVLKTFKHSVTSREIDSPVIMRKLFRKKEVYSFNDLNKSE